MPLDEVRAKEIFVEAVEMASAAEREAYLDQACSDDQALRREVEELLGHHAGLGSFLEGLPAEESPPVAEGPGTTIGPYKLLEEIGEGGFGVVYVAEQSAPVRRRVALKVIKAGMDTREVVSRFEAERQALAIMDHPHIARVFDGGSTPSGRPYFVMELVKGIPIQEYCDQCHLALRERLALFVKVCKAVQHAHQKGIIHRDLKPSNVLVEMQDGKPAPKVIDFGVAKATGTRLTEATFHTRFAQMIGTPQYMSPEQAEMSALDVDTRSDIYSLGVLLYELLTGTTPLTRERLKTIPFDELRRIIREEDPPTPSGRLTSLNGDGAQIAAARRTELRRLVRMVHGELDWIVMKSLEKDRTRRYDTATALAADVEHYLADEPVEAGPPSAWYRGRKFVRRNKTSLAAAAVVGAVIVFAGWNLLDRAARRGALEKQITAALEETESSYRAGRLPSAMASLQRAEGLAAGSEASDEIAQAVRRWRKDLEMVARLEEARLERMVLVDGGWDKSAVASAYREAFAWYDVDVGALDREQAAARIERSAIKDVLVTALDSWSAQKQRGDEWKRLINLVRTADSDPWRRRFRDAAMRYDKKALKDLTKDHDALEQPLATLHLLATTLAQAGEGALAVEVYREAQQRHPDDLWINFDLAKTLMSFEPPRAAEAVGYCRVTVALRPESSGVHLDLGHALFELGDFDQADAATRKSIELQPDSARAHNNLAVLHVERGNLGGAMAAYRRAIEINPALAVPHVGLGLTLQELGDLVGSIAAFNKAIELQPDNAPVHISLGNVLMDRGNLSDAIAAYNKAIELQPDYADSHRNLGAALRVKGELDAAIASYREAIRLDPNLAAAHNGIGVILCDFRKDYDGAIASFRQAIRLAPDDADASNAHFNLGNALRRKGDQGEAIAAYRMAIELQPDNGKAHNNLGIALKVKGDLDGAIAASRRAIELQPDYGAAHYDLGNALIAKGDVDGAIAAYRKAIEHDYGTAHNNLGIALMAKGDLDGAIAAYRKAIELQPDKGNTHNNLGNALKAKGNLDGAIAAYRMAIELQPDNGKAHNNLGIALKVKGDLDGAIAASRRAIELQPDNGVLHYTLGQALKAKGDLDGAIAAYRKASELDPEFTHAHILLAYALRERGRLDEAIAHWKKALATLTPTDAWSHNALAWKLATFPDASFRDPKRAVQIGRRSIELDRNNWRYWNTLGVALWYAGDHEASVDALRESMKLQTVSLKRNGGPYDWFFLAMALWKLDQKDEARKWYGQAASWMDEHKPDKQLRRFHAEAEELLKIEKK